MSSVLNLIKNHKIPCGTSVTNMLIAAYAFIGKLLQMSSSDFILNIHFRQLFKKIIIANDMSATKNDDTLFEIGKRWKRYRHRWLTAFIHPLLGLEPDLRIS